MAKDMYQKRRERQEKNSNTEIENKTNINWYPGHMAKTKRLIKENIDKIDIVFEVVDARIPYSTRVRELDETIVNKPKIVVFTKMDLCDRRETNKWVKYYESNGDVVVCLDLEHNPDLKPLFDKTKQLMESHNQKRLDKGMIVRKTRALIIGVPNAGKSTLINRLVGKKAVNVGNKPGVTKELNWIRINDELELLDTPGILWPKLAENNVALNLACFTAIKEEILPIYEVIEYFLRKLKEFYPDKLQERYGLTEIDEDIVAALDIIGKRRGCLIKGGEIDYDKVIQIIMSDIREGLIGNITFDRFNYLDKNDILNTLKKYELDKNEFIILSGASLVLQDVKKYAKDIDMTVSKTLEQHLLNKYPYEIECVNNNGNNVYYIDNVLNFSIDLSDVDSIIVDGYNIQTLDSIVELKKKLNRDKDKLDIEMINKFRDEVK